MLSGNRRHAAGAECAGRRSPYSGWKKEGEQITGMASRWTAIKAVTLSLLLLPLPAWAAPVTPFYTQNQSPIALIFGLPAAGSAAVTAKGRIGAILSTDVANNFAVTRSDNESITFDGESYRVNLAVRYGITKKIDGGIDIPYIGIGGGTFDSFIDDWHSFFGLPTSNRENTPRNRIDYSYISGGKQRLLLVRSGSGLGDIKLTGGYQLYNDKQANPRQLVMRASLKLPTGSAAALRGSGSTDFALWLDAADDYQLPAWGHFTLFGSAGAMAMSTGQVLKTQQNNIAGFGTIGFGWAPTAAIDFKVQAAGHSAFFRGSDLAELANPALQMIFGGSVHFDDKTALDIGVSEDVAVNTSPDVALHLALRRQF